MKASKEFEYLGTDNLEIMREAVNYNSFLSSLVEMHCVGATDIVDFGAGIGTFAIPLHADRRNVIAVEPDKNQRLVLTSLGLANVADISMIEDGWADTVYSINVLEHIEDDEAALHNIYLKLKPSGKVFIYVPAFQILYSSMDRKVGHFRRYRKSELNDKMRRAGLEVVDSRYADSMGFLASLFFKYAGNDAGDINRKALSLFDTYIFPVSRFIDRFVSGWFGKNLVVVAVRKPASVKSNG
jgi:SAM-dependent methyltransferase